MKSTWLALLVALSGSCGVPFLPENQTAEDFLESEVLQTAIRQSGFGYTLGSNPLNIEGQYRVAGRTSAASISSLVGESITSTYCYYGQSGTHISSVETQGGYVSRGPGQVLTGDNVHFTSWKDAHVSGSCEQRTYVLLSGTATSSGFSYSALVVVIELYSSCGPNVRVGTWVRRDGTFTRSGACSG